MENNIIDFEAKKLELFAKKREEECQKLTPNEDFLRGELFVVEGLIEYLEHLKRTRTFSFQSLVESLYMAKKDLSKTLEDNEPPRPIS